MVYSVIGAHFGDEGKGLAVDYFSSKSDSTLVIRHNGGAQSGHTVEMENKRFVFHELSSGSLRKADTFYARTFMPDMYKLSDEIEEFKDIFGFVPRIYADPDCLITTIDDVLINMLIESARGDKRHGSCGMGINEADLRNKAGFIIPFSSLKSMDSEGLFLHLKKIREEYSKKRVREELCKHNSDGCQIDGWDCKLNKDAFKMDECDEYFRLLNDDDVLFNYSKQVIENLKYVEVVTLDSIFDDYENVIFEAGQGLRLDSEYSKNWPHVTGSRTGLTNVISILNSIGRKLDEAIYVSRTYGTKHGAGFLKNEDPGIKDYFHIDDKTNIHNEWQGELRFYKWEDVDEFMEPILEDLKICPYDIDKSIFITHLNETEGKVVLKSGDVSYSVFLTGQQVFNKAYLSDSPFGNVSFMQVDTE